MQDLTSSCCTTASMKWGKRLSLNAESSDVSECFIAATNMLFEWCAACEWCAGGEERAGEEGEGGGGRDGNNGGQNGGNEQ
eukprot:5916941-Pleurochrysis_carterae.AAC.1